MPQSQPQVSLVDRQGISLASLIFRRDLQWIFREQPISDVGIDATVEIVSSGCATGNLLALQIKSGDSFFAEPVAEAMKETLLGVLAGDFSYSFRPGVGMRSRFSRGNGCQTEGLMA